MKVNSMVIRNIKTVVSGSLLGFALIAFVGCGSDRTGGGDVDFSDATFVASDDSTGSLSLSISTPSIEVGDGRRYSATLKDADGGPVAGARLRCLGESGVTTDVEGGIAITDVWGSVSGTVFCLAPGSYQFLCQHLGTTRRVVTTIKCTGDPLVDDDDSDADFL